MLLEPSQSPQPVRDVGQLLLWWLQSGTSARRHGAALGLVLATTTTPAPSDVPFIGTSVPTACPKHLTNPSAGLVALAKSSEASTLL